MSVYKEGKRESGYSRRREGDVRGGEKDREIFTILKKVIPRREGPPKNRRGEKFLEGLGGITTRKYHASCSKEDIAAKTSSSQTEGQRGLPKKVVQTRPSINGELPKLGFRWRQNLGNTLSPGRHPTVPFG